MEAQATAKDLLPGIEANISVADLSAEAVAQILNRMRSTKMRAVEALSIAIRYFSKFPIAALSFASQAADEARHLAALTGRVIDLDGTFAPNPSRSELLELLPGFKVDAQGDCDAMAGFVSRLYAAQQAKLLRSEETALLLEGDKLTQRIVSRIARDERLHLTSIRRLQDWLASEGHENEVSALAADGQSSLQVS